MISLFNRSKHWSHFLDNFSLVDDGHIVTNEDSQQNGTQGNRLAFFCKRKAKVQTGKELAKMGYASLDF